MTRPEARWPSVRTVLVHDWLTGMRGGEKVLAEIAALAPDAPIHTLFHFPGALSPELERRRIVTSRLQPLARAVPNYRYLLPLFPSAIESLDLAGYDLVVSVSHSFAKSVRRAPGAIHVCYCNTPVRYAWDQQDAYFPRGGGLAAALRRRYLARLRRWDVATAPRVDHYLANSSFIAERIRKYYGREATVLHPPVDVEFFRPEERDREPFALVASALVPYKRIDLAIEACRRLELPLKIVGTGPERARLERLAGGGVEFLGWTEPERLRDLLQRAAVFLQPGVEDFGIAPVEALACACPVVALGEGGVRDIVADRRHGVLYQPADDAEALAGAIDKCRQTRFNFLDLRQRAEAFSRQRFREGLLQALDRAIHKLAASEEPS